MYTKLSGKKVYKANKKKMSSSEVKVCPDCKGRETVQKYIRTDHTHGAIYETEKCKRCEGSGRIEVTITVIEKPYKH